MNVFMLDKGVKWLWGNDAFNINALHHNIKIQETLIREEELASTHVNWIGCCGNAQLLKG